MIAQGSSATNDDSDGEPMLDIPLSVLTANPQDPEALQTIKSTYESLNAREKIIKQRRLEKSGDQNPDLSANNPEVLTASNDPEAKPEEEELVHPDEDQVKSVGIVCSHFESEADFRRAIEDAEECGADLGDNEPDFLTGHEPSVCIATMLENEEPPKDETDVLSELLNPYVCSPPATATSLDNATQTRATTREQGSSPVDLAASTETSSAPDTRSVTTLNAEVDAALTLVTNDSPLEDLETFPNPRVNNAASVVLIDSGPEVALQPAIPAEFQAQFVPLLSEGGTEPPPSASTSPPIQPRNPDDKFEDDLKMMQSLGVAVLNFVLFFYLALVTFELSSRLANVMLSPITLIAAFILPLSCLYTFVEFIIILGIPSPRVRFIHNIFLIMQYQVGKPGPLTTVSDHAPPKASFRPYRSIALLSLCTTGFWISALEAFFHDGVNLGFFFILLFIMFACVVYSTLSLNSHLLNYTRSRTFDESQYHFLEILFASLADLDDPQLASLLATETRVRRPRSAKAEGDEWIWNPSSGTFHPVPHPVSPSANETGVTRQEELEATRVALVATFAEPTMPRLQPLESEDEEEEAEEDPGEDTDDLWSGDEDDIMGAQLDAALKEPTPGRASCLAASIMRCDDIPILEQEANKGNLITGRRTLKMTFDRNDLYRTRIFLSVFVENTLKVPGMVDTGATVSLMSFAFLSKLEHSLGRSLPVMYRDQGIYGVGGIASNCKVVKVSLSLESDNRTVVILVDVPVYIVDLSIGLVLGQNVVKKMQLSMNFDDPEAEVTFAGKHEYGLLKPLKVRNNLEVLTADVGPSCLAVSILPGTSKVINCTIKNVGGCQTDWDNRDCLLYSQRDDLEEDKVRYTEINSCHNGVFPVSITNASVEPIEIFQDEELFIAELMDKVPKEDVQPIIEDILMAEAEAEMRSMPHCICHDDNSRRAFVADHYGRTYFSRAPMGVFDPDFMTQTPGSRVSTRGRDDIYFVPCETFGFDKFHSEENVEGLQAHCKDLDKRTLYVYYAHPGMLTYNFIQFIDRLRRITTVHLYELDATKFCHDCRQVELMSLKRNNDLLVVSEVHLVIPYKRAFPKDFKLFGHLKGTPVHQFKLLNYATVTVMLYKNSAVTMFLHVEENDYINEKKVANLVARMSEYGKMLYSFAKVFVWSCRGDKEEHFELVASKIMGGFKSVKRASVYVAPEEKLRGKVTTIVRDNHRITEHIKNCNCGVCLPFSPNNTDVGGKLVLLYSGNWPNPTVDEMMKMPTGFKRLDDIVKRLETESNPSLPSDLLQSSHLREKHKPASHGKAKAYCADAADVPLGATEPNLLFDDAARSFYSSIHEEPEQYEYREQEGSSAPVRKHIPQVFATIALAPSQTASTQSSVAKHKRDAEGRLPFKPNQTCVPSVTTLQGIDGYINHEASSFVERPAIVSAAISDMDLDKILDTPDILRKAEKRAEEVHGQDFDFQGHTDESIFRDLPILDKKDPPLSMKDLAANFDFSTISDHRCFAPLITLLFFLRSALKVLSGEYGILSHRRANLRVKTKYRHCTFLAKPHVVSDQHFPFFEELVGEYHKKHWWQTATDRSRLRVTSPAFLVPKNSDAKLRLGTQENMMKMRGDQSHHSIINFGLENYENAKQETGHKNLLFRNVHLNSNPAPKTSADFRVVIDMRVPNMIISSDPLDPNSVNSLSPSAIAEKAAGSFLISAIDIASGFPSILVSEQSRSLLGVALYRLACAISRVLSLGLKTAPALWTIMLLSCLSEATKRAILNYLDDLSLFSRGTKRNYRKLEMEELDLVHVYKDLAKLRKFSGFLHKVFGTRPPDPDIICEMDSKSAHAASQLEDILSVHYQRTKDKPALFIMKVKKGIRLITWLSPEQKIKALKLFENENYGQYELDLLCSEHLSNNNGKDHPLEVWQKYRTDRGNDFEDKIKEYLAISKDWTDVRGATDENTRLSRRSMALSTPQFLSKIRAIERIPIECDYTLHELLCKLDPDEILSHEAILLNELRVPSTRGQKFEHLLDDMNLPENPCTVERDDLTTEQIAIHLSDLYNILVDLQVAGLKVSFAKLALCRDRVKYMGKIISTTKTYILGTRRTFMKGLWPTKAKKMTIKSLQSLLGLANFMASHVHGLHIMAKPLYASVAARAPQEFLTVFETKLARRLLLNMIAAPPLWHPMTDRPLYVSTDASMMGIGVVAFQYGNDNRTRPVMFFSKTLNSAEARMHSLTLEVSGIKYAIQQLGSMCETHEVIVITDCRIVWSILKTLSVPVKTSALSRLCYSLQTANIKFKVSWRPCTNPKMILSDQLSRLNPPELIIPSSHKWAGAIAELQEFDRVRFELPLELRDKIFALNEPDILLHLIETKGYKKTQAEMTLEDKEFLQKMLRTSNDKLIWKDFMHPDERDEIRTLVDDTNLHEIPNAMFEPQGVKLDNEDIDRFRSHFENPNRSDHMDALPLPEVLAVSQHKVDKVNKLTRDNLSIKFSEVRLAQRRNYFYNNVILKLKAMETEKPLVHEGTSYKLLPNGLLARHSKKYKEQIVLTMSMAFKIMVAIHCYAHQNVRSTLLAFRDRFYIHNSEQLGRALLNSCLMCSMIHPKSGISSSPIGSLVNEGTIWTTAHIDIFKTTPITMFKTTYVYVLIYVDAASKMCFLMPIVNMKLDTIIKAMTNLWNSIPVPKLIVADRQFAEYKKPFKKFLTSKNVDLYNPMPNVEQNHATVERQIRVVRSVLNLVCLVHKQPNWGKYLNMIHQALWSLPRLFKIYDKETGTIKETKMSPYYYVFAEKPADNMTAFLDEVAPVRTTKSKKQQAIRDLRQQVQDAADHLKQEQDERDEAWIKRRKLTKGDLCLRLNPARTGALGKSGVYFLRDIFLVQNIKERSVQIKSLLVDPEGSASTVHLKECKGYFVSHKSLNLLPPLWQSALGIDVSLEELINGGVIPFALQELTSAKKVHQTRQQTRENPSNSDGISSQSSSAISQTVTTSFSGDDDIEDSSDDEDYEDLGGILDLNIDHVSDDDDNETTAQTKHVSVSVAPRNLVSANGPAPINVPQEVKGFSEKVMRWETPSPRPVINEDTYSQIVLDTVLEAGSARSSPPSLAPELPERNPTPTPVTPTPKARSLRRLIKKAFSSRKSPSSNGAPPAPPAPAPPVKEKKKKKVIEPAQNTRPVRIKKKVDRYGSWAE